MSKHVELGLDAVHNLAQRVTPDSAAATSRASAATLNTSRIEDPRTHAPLADEDPILDALWRAMCAQYIDCSRYGGPHTLGILGFVLEGHAPSWNDGLVRTAEEPHSVDDDLYPHPRHRNDIHGTHTCESGAHSHRTE